MSTPFGSGFGPKPVSTPSGGGASSGAQVPNMAVLLLLRSLATPVVLYADAPTQLYDEIKTLMTQANPQAPKLIEKPGMGPLKKVAFLDTDVLGVALQSDQGLPQR
ncbi:MAG: hypothetical protein VKK59_04655 [Vampirovibrionales bacterium]|nr:hypothetical protein [Vampirovibrionales bacterium]